MTDKNSPGYSPKAVNEWLAAINILYTHLPHWYVHDGFKDKWEFLRSLFGDKR